MTLDPVSSLLLDEAGLGTAAEPGTAAVLVIDDPALASHLHSAGHHVSAYCDDLRDERLLTFAGLDTLDATTLAEVGLVLLRLPKSLGMLEDYAQRVAALALPEVRLLAGGRQKHLTHSMNEVLAGSFTAVRASLGRQKSRVLHATGPKPAALTWPRTVHLPDQRLTVVSHAGVFAADKLDGGTRLLLDAVQTALRPVDRLRVDQAQGSSEAHGASGIELDAPARWLSLTKPRPDSETSATAEPRAVDLGCGSGILAAWLAERRYDVLAVDVSHAACASARDTAAANGVAVEVLRTDGLSGHRPSSVDLVVCNPPFHRGTTKDSTPGFDLLRSAIPALVRGAEVWTVFNSHLPYLPFLRSEIGPTRVVVRDRHYTVTRSRFSPAPRPRHPRLDPGSPPTPNPTAPLPPT